MQVSPTSDGHGPAPSVSTLRLVLILGALSAFGPMSIDMYLPAFPQMARDLGVPLGTIQLSISAFLFGSAAGQLFYGPLADRWGRRIPLLLGLSLFVAACVGCTFVRSGAGLIAWRVVMALGGGAGMVISRAVVRDRYRTTEAARIFSLLMLVMGVAPILAPIAGSQLLLLVGWRGIFGVLTAFGLACLCAVAGWLPETMPRERRVRHTPGEMLGAYGALLRHRSYLRYVVALGCISGVTFAYISGSPFLFIELHHISPQRFALFFGVNSAGLIGASQVNRFLLHRFSSRQILGKALLVHAAAALLFAATSSSSFPLAVVLLFVCISTLGLLYPNLTALAMAPFDRTAGSASALMGTIQYLLGASAGAAVGLLHNGTALPMTCTIAACSLIAWAVVPRPSSEPGCPQEEERTTAVALAEETP